MRHKGTIDDEMSSKLEKVYLEFHSEMCKATYDDKNLSQSWHQ